MPGYRLEITQLHEHARALGYVIITWGYLQSSIAELLKALLPIQDNIAKNILSGNIDERDQIKIIRELGWYCFNSFKNEHNQYDGFSELLNTIDNDLRPKRNRFVHDLWISSSQDGNPILFDTRTRMAKQTQNGQKIPIQGNTTPISEEEIWDFIQNVQSATTQIVQFRIQL
jgi:hypothetical protein